MADEIVSTWADVGELVDELITDKDNDRKARVKHLEIGDLLTMHYRLQDGQGNPIIWPLTLISDTTPRR